MCCDIIIWKEKGEGKKGERGKREGDSLRVHVNLFGSLQNSDEDIAVHIRPRHYTWQHWPHTGQ